MDKAKLRLRMIRRLHRMKNELEQLIRDKEWWNENRTDSMPIDMGWERAMLQCVDGQLAAWDRNDIDSVNYWNARIQATGREIE